MAESADAKEGHLDQAEFKKKMLSQLQSTGVVGQVKSQLRAQLLSQLQKGQIVQLGPPPGDRPGLKRHALNSMIADYLGAVQYHYSLSVFKEESGVESRPLLTEDELFDVLKVDRETSFYQAYMKSKAHGGSDSCFILNLLNAISEAAAAKGKESFTQTVGGDRYQLEVRMLQLENEYQARLREARMAPGAGLEERLALYRQEIEEQAAAEVARQVERIRDMEVAAARLDEAAKARRAMEGERLELDRLHAERLAKLRAREEEMMDKLRRQQRDVENVAYEYRQRILREEERLRNYKTELEQQQDGRQEQLKQLERSLELRERAVAAREAAAEKKLAEATEAAAEAQVAARQDVEREYLELKNGLAQQRMQLEMDRSRILELRSEATAEIAAARAKEDRLRALETARAEAEARAAAHAADAEVCRLQAEKLALELNQVRDELSRRLAQAADGADAMLQNAAGAMNMLNAEAVASRAAGSQIRDALAQLERAREEAASATAAVAELQQERAGLQAALSTSTAEAETLRTQLGRVEALLDEAVAARAAALSSAEEVQFRAFQQERELSELRSVLSRSKDEAAALRMQAAVAGAVAGRRPPSRGADSPSRRSLTVSPPRRPPPGGAAATISALSLGLAFGGGGSGGQQHHHHHHQQPGGVWQYRQSVGGGSVVGGTPAMSNVEFPIAAAPRDSTTLERLERLRRHEDMVASQEESFRKRVSMLQEVRSRGLAMLTHSGGAGASPGRHYSEPSQPAQGLEQLQGLGQQQQQQLYQQQLQVPYQATASFAQERSPPPPYMTYVMHSSPTQHSTAYDQQQSVSPQTTLQEQQQQYQQQQQQQQQRHVLQQYDSGLIRAGTQAHAELLEQEQQYLYAFQQQQQQQQQLLQLQQQGPQQQEMRQQEMQQREEREQLQQQYLREQQQEQARQEAQYVSQYQHQQHQVQQGQRQPHQSDLHNSPQQEGNYRQQAPPGGGPYGPGGPTGSGATAGVPLQLAASAAAAAQTPAVNVGAFGSEQQQQPHPERSGTSGTHESPYGVADGVFLQAAPSAFLTDTALSQQLPQQEQQPYGAPSGQTEPAAVAEPQRAETEPAGPPPRATTPPVVLPPAGLVLTSNLRPAGTVPTNTDQPPTASEPPPPPVDPPKITIPGLVMVSGFAPRPSTNTSSTPPPPPVAVVEPLAVVQAPPPPGDVEDLMAAKMRMLQEQRERALAAQQQQQQQQGWPPARRLTSKTSISIRASEPSVGSPGAGGHLPRGEDSTSELIAAGEADDTVAPELSTLQRRATGGRRTSHEGGGLVSRQSSVSRRDLARGTSFVRSEASGMSVEVPGLSGQSARALSVGLTVDDIPSSLEGYELPGLNDDDEGLEAGGEDDRYGGFATEMSAGSVF